MAERDEEMTDIPLSIVQGKSGTFYGTSDAMRGLLVIGNSPEEVREHAPRAIAELRAVKRWTNAPAWAAPEPDDSEPAYRDAFEVAKAMLHRLITDKYEKLMDAEKLKMYPLIYPAGEDGRAAQPRIITDEEKIGTAKLAAAVEALFEVAARAAMMEPIRRPALRFGEPLPPFREMEQVILHAWLAGWQAGKNAGHRCIEQGYNASRDPVSADALTLVNAELYKAAPLTPEDIMRGLNIVLRPMAREAIRAEDEAS